MPHSLPTSESSSKLPLKDVARRSLDLHRQRHGKLEVASKIPLATKDDLSLAYTPGVAEPCREIAKDPQKVYEYTLKRNTVAVVSDGSAVLGLGNIGPAAAIPVMEGKAILFKILAGVDAFPICLATQDPDKIVEAVKHIAPVFGGINLEDIAAPACFEIEERLKKELDIPVMHDDQHATAVVVLAGLINALKLTGRAFSTSTLVISGAGAAGIAVAKMLKSSGAKQIILCDTAGVVYKGRKENMNPQKMAVAADTAARTLADALHGADVFIGLSKPNVLSSAMIKAMNAGPIIFALANPDPEILPPDALAAGAAVVATGRSDFPNQVNNVLAFPGIFRGALDARAGAITEKMKLAAAHAIAGCVKNPAASSIIPSALDPAVSKAVAEAVKKAAA
ncbi:NAD-dependent malic enzyme [Candidatus Woesearchaeota archaeon]|nr:NAD-dependent malic enzyme [Candidatus Woesearchaeota archaeon]